MPQDQVERFISELRSEADLADFSDLAEPAIARVSRQTLIGRLRTRVAAVAAVVVATFGGLGGIAYAADGAVPGDMLYGVDRALEVVGIGNGGASERLDEVIKLIEQGDAARGLEHAADVFESDVGAATALLAAAERIGSADNSPANAGVATLLTYLAKSSGEVDGATVAEMAKAIRGNDEAGPPSDVTPGPPSDVTPGPPSDVTPGPPSDVSPGGPPSSTP